MSSSATSDPDSKRNTLKWDIILKSKHASAAFHLSTSLNGAFIGRLALRSTYAGHCTLLSHLFFVNTVKVIWVLLEFPGFKNWFFVELLGTSRSRTLCSSSTAAGTSARWYNTQTDALQQHPPCLCPRKKQPVVSSQGNRAGSSSAAFARASCKSAWPSALLFLHQLFTAVIMATSISRDNYWGDLLLEGW